MKKVLCIGHASYDITIPMDKYPLENIKYRVSERVECGGGPASNAAYLLGKWGINTFFAGVVGNDNYGKIIKGEFESVNVNTKYLELNKKFSTTSSFIIVNKSKASRTIFTYRKSELKSTPKKIDIKPDYILVDGEDLDLAMKTISENPKSISILDAGRAKYANIKLGKMVDYLVTSRNFAEDFTGEVIDLKNFNSIVRIFDKLEKDFKCHIVITIEDKGCLYKIDGKVKLMPGYKVNGVDSTGAGDIFHGAFVYALASGYNYEDTLRIANIAGALSVRKIGGRYSVPSIAEVLDIFNECR